MPNQLDLRSVLKQYSQIPGIEYNRCRVYRVEQGFSGTQVFKIKTIQNEFCLRCLPARTNLENVVTTQFILGQVADSLPIQIPVPIPTGQGQPALVHQNQIWQLEPWVPGRAVEPVDWSANHLSQAIDFLSKFHYLTEKVDTEAGIRKNSVEPTHNPKVVKCRSKSITDRLLFFDQLSAGKLEEIQHEINNRRTDRLKHLGRSICSDFVVLKSSLSHDLNHLAQAELPLIPAIRDCRAEHFLFSESGKLSGYIDFGAMQFDTTATDISRLLADTILPEKPQVQQLIERYKRTRNLTKGEETAIIALGNSTVILSGLMWLNWLLLEKWQFSSQEDVLNRLQHWCRQINRLVESGRKNDDV